MRIVTFSDQFVLLRGLSALRQEGLTPRGLLFLALGSQGRSYVAIPDDMTKLDQSHLRIGEKLALRWPVDARATPLPGQAPSAQSAPIPDRLYHFDSIHALRDDFCVINGDRRLSHPGNAIEIAAVVARFIRSFGTTSVFFGCTPHQPGTWLQGGPQIVALHDYGYVEVVPVDNGLLARRMHDHRLFYLAYADIARSGHLEGWLPCYAAPFGNILLVERRVVDGRLVLSCERGLVEVDVSELPRVYERARLPFLQGVSAFQGDPDDDEDYDIDDLNDEISCPAVLGRLGSEGYVLTRGRPQPWGLKDLEPAEVWGAPTGELVDIKSWLGEIEEVPAAL